MGVSEILIVVQARMESRRLPGKVLLPMLGQPMLLWMLSRLAPLSYPLVVAAPNEGNTAIADVCAKHGYRCHMVDGDPKNVLHRFAHVVQLYPDAHHIVRIGGDTPLLDPEVIENLIGYHLHQLWRRDYTGLTHEWGDGNDAEIFTRETLLVAEAEAKAPHELEHVSPYIWQDPQRFRIAHYPCPLDLSGMRSSVDTHEDFLHAQMLLEKCLLKYGFGFGWREAWLVATQDATVRQYMKNRSINTAYVTQIGNEKSWHDIRYGKSQ